MNLDLERPSLQREAVDGEEIGSSIGYGIKAVVSVEVVAGVQICGREVDVAKVVVKRLAKKDGPVQILLEATKKLKWHT